MASKLSNKGDILYSYWDTITVQVAVDSSNAANADMGYSPADYVGMTIKRIEYYTDPDPTFGMKAALAADGDGCQFGLKVTSNSIFTFQSPGYPGILDFNEVKTDLRGAPAQYDVIKQPFIVKDYTWMPEGGIFTHPASVYCWTYTTNAIAAIWIMGLKVYYTLKDLAESDYQKLMNVISVLRV